MQISKRSGPSHGEVIVKEDGGVKRENKRAIGRNYKRPINNLCDDIFCFQAVVVHSAALHGKADKGQHRRLGATAIASQESKESEN